MDEGVLSNPTDHVDIVDYIGELSGRCARSDGGNNPCTDNTYSDNPNAMISDVIGSKESDFLAYSEVIGQVLYTEPSVQVKSVIVPHLSGAGYLTVYTDALVANRNTYEAKKNVIKQFIKFYTSLQFRQKYAFCEDMESSCVRYVLPANLEFYIETVQKDKFYSMLYDVIMESGTPGPNHELYCRKDSLDASISQMLHY
eukprot:Em0004g1720a